MNDLDEMTSRDSLNDKIRLMKLKLKLKICCGIIGAASLLTAPSVYATILGEGTLTITAPGFSPANNWDQAGPYLVYNLKPTSGLVPINTGGSFDTFCIGTQVDYYPGSSYGYQISDTVLPTAGVAPGYVVTWGTAWLYSQYRAGKIGDGSANDATDDALQEAIWHLQQQSLSGVSFSAGFSQTSVTYSNFLSAAASAAVAAHVSVSSDADGAFGVYAFDMLSGPNDYAQPQLCLVPVPEPATFLAGGLMLLPFGASALRLVRKRLA